MCAIFGVWNAENAAELTAIGLHGEQHRAIDYAGIVTSDCYHLYRQGGTGLARQVFTKDKLARLHGIHALGHLRYPTVADDATRDNIQPIMSSHGHGRIALAHNGNLTNTAELGERYPHRKTSMDTEYFLRAIESWETEDIERDLPRALEQLKGSYALGILLPDRLIAVRDQSGNRPLSISKANGSYFISSETSAFGGVGAEFLCDVEAGTMVSIDEKGLRTIRFAQARLKQCRFEGIYLAHPSSTVFGESVTAFRMRLGRALQEECPVPGADIVTPIPDSANFIAMGYGESRKSGAYWPVINRSHYVGRTFIAATQAGRDADVAQKFSFTASEIKGKNIVVVDDSIVRGTTMPKIVSELRRYGAQAIHVRIAAPPIMHPCTYGINTPTRKELISASQTPEEIREFVGADSLEFLSLETLQKLSGDAGKFCFACMDGKYWD